MLAWLSHQRKQARPPAIIFEQGGYHQKNPGHICYLTWNSSGLLEYDVQRTEEFELIKGCIRITNHISVPWQVLRKIKQNNSCMVNSGERSGYASLQRDLPKQHIQTPKFESSCTVKHSSFRGMLSVPSSSLLIQPTHLLGTNSGNACLGQGQDRMIRLSKLSTTLLLFHY